MKCAIRRVNAASDRALIFPHAAPKNGGKSWVRNVTLVITPNVPPPPPLERPKQIGIVEFVDYAHLAIGGDDFGFEQSRRCCAETL